MKKLISITSLVVLTAALAATVSSQAAVSAPAGQLPGAWHGLSASPVVPDFDSAQAVWTGTRMLAFGHDTVTALDARGTPYAKGTVNVAAAYDPATNSWRRLSPPSKADATGGDHAVWTGKEMLVLSAFSTLAYNPTTNHWRRLPRGHGGLVVWTGREAIAWGGGCCGDAFSDGVALNPATDTWRKLAVSPLAGSQQPIGAWTGRELVVLVGNLDPDGKPWPAGLARAAAYNPSTNTWRRIAPLPAPRDGASAVWNGHELLVVGGRAGLKAPTVGFAYNPSTNAWRRLAPMPSGRSGADAVWTGDRLLLWGGAGAGGRALASGLAYDPTANRWSSLPRGPLSNTLQATAVWAGRRLIVWGGMPTKTWGEFVPAGAVFAPTER